MPVVTYLDFTSVGSKQLAAASKGKGLRLLHFALGNGLLPKGVLPADCRELIEKRSTAELLNAQISSTALRVQGQLDESFANTSFSFSEIGLYARFSGGEPFLLAYANVEAPLKGRSVGQMAAIVERKIDIIVTLDREVEIQPLTAPAKKGPLKWDHQELSVYQLKCEKLSVDEIDIRERLLGDTMHIYADRAASIYIQDARAIGIARDDSGQSHDVFMTGRELEFNAHESCEVKVGGASALRLVHDEMAGQTAMHFDLAQGTDLHVNDLMMSSRLQVSGADYALQAPAIDHEGRHIGALKIEGGLSCDRIDSSSLPSGVSISMDEQKKAHMTGLFGNLRFVVSVEDTSPSGDKGVFLKILCGGAAVNAKRGVILQLSMTTTDSEVAKRYQRLYIADIKSELSTLCYEKLDGKLDELKRIEATVFVL